jgi:hypothetical protein
MPKAHPGTFGHCLVEQIWWESLLERLVFSGKVFEAG